MQRTAESTMSPSDIADGCAKATKAPAPEPPREYPNSPTVLAVCVAEAELDIRRIKTGIGLLIIACVVISACVLTAMCERR